MLKLIISSIVVWVTAVFGAPPAKAGDWVFVSADERTAIAVDISGIRTVRGRAGQPAVALWAITVYSEPQLRGNNTFDYRLTRHVVDCNADTIASTASIGYELDESQTVFSDSESGVPRSIIPDSVGSAFRDAACDRGLQTSGIQTAPDAAILARAYLSDDEREYAVTVSDLNFFSQAVMTSIASENDARLAAGDVLSEDDSDVGRFVGDTAADAAARADAAATDAAAAAGEAADAAAQWIEPKP